MPLLTTAARCLVEVAEAGSIRRAAEHMNLSASAVNRQILNLEDELGTRLLERLPRGVTLTPAGILVLDRINRFGKEIDDLHIDLKQIIVSDKRTDVKIGVMDCLIGDVFTRLLHDVAALYKSLNFKVHVSFLASDLLERLNNHELDLVIVFDPLEQYKFWSICSVNARVGVVMPPQHPFSHRSHITLSECYAEQLFIPDRSMIMGRLIQDALPKRLQFLSFQTNSLRLIRETIK